MVAITASMVGELRAKTDAPMMECKKALTEALGDMARAEEILRVKLGSKASKAASRITAEGVITSLIDSNEGVLLEINCETDFVSKNDDFLKFDEKSVDTYKEKGYVTFWLFDLRSALPDFFVRATQLCLKWSIANAAILLLSERGLPSFDGWDLITSTDLGYDGSRQIWMYRLKRS